MLTNINFAFNLFDKIFFRKLKWHKVLDYDNLITSGEEAFNMKFEDLTMTKLKNHVDYKTLLAKKDKEIIDKLYSKWLWKYA